MTMILTVTVTVRVSVTIALVRGEIKTKEEQLLQIWTPETIIWRDLRELPVLGFNSSDVNVVKKSLFEVLINDDDSVLKFTVKKNNSYLCINAEKLKFLDTGFSYDQFLNSTKVVLSLRIVGSSR